MRRIALVTLVLAVALVVPERSAAQARSCGNTFGGDLVTAYDMGCKRARAVVRAWARKFQRSNGVVRQRALRFKCRGRNDSVEGLVMRCRRGDKSVRFYANVPI